ncbi:MAG: hypothetical protein R2873_29505 [Caldilineaceae bacterium]
MGDCPGSLIGFGIAIAGVAVAAGASSAWTCGTKSYSGLELASGIVAYLLLWASVAWGLLLSTRWASI